MFRVSVRPRHRHETIKLGSTAAFALLVRLPFDARNQFIVFPRTIKSHFLARWLWHVILAQVCFFVQSSLIVRLDWSLGQVFAVPDLLPGEREAVCASVQHSSTQILATRDGPIHGQGPWSSS